jgi:alkylation response protein AidB-like acyl-CoA dehydrogenase
MAGFVSRGAHALAAPTTVNVHDSLREAAADGSLAHCDPRRSDAPAHVRALARRLGRQGALGVAITHVVHLTAPLRLICEFGDLERQRRWLSPAACGEVLATALLPSEPEGDEVQHWDLTIRHVGDALLLDGTARDVMNLPGAEFAVVAAPAQDRPGTVVVIVALDASGITVTRRTHTGPAKLAVGTVSFAGCRVPAAEVLVRGEGIGTLLAQRIHEQRLLICEATLSFAEGMLDATLDYAIDRPFGERSLVDLQVVRHRLADRVADIRRARALLDAVLADGDGATAPVSVSVSMTELVTLDAAVATVDDCLQFLGGRGFLVEHGIPQAFRDGLSLHAIFTSRHALEATIAARCLP